MTRRAWADLGAALFGMFFLYGSLYELFVHEEGVHYARVRWEEGRLDVGADVQTFSAALMAVAALALIFSSAGPREARWRLWIQLASLALSVLAWFWAAHHFFTVAFRGVG
jgi:hypothetical protein